MYFYSPWRKVNNFSPSIVQSQYASQKIVHINVDVAYRCVSFKKIPDIVPIVSKHNCYVGQICRLPT